MGNLIADSSGNLYGVTEGGGCTPTGIYPTGCGIVFKLAASTGAPWTETILYTFKGGATDGAWPIGPLARDSAGNIYGVTQFGGTDVGPCGELGQNPFGNGFTGDNRCGTVFKLSYNSSGGTYSESILHLFSDGSDGSIPSGGVVLDSKGNVYGTTLQGGTAGACGDFGYSGCGVVFELTGSGTTYTKSNIWSFGGTNPADGAAPSALLISRKGRLYGVNSNNTSSETCSASAYYCGTAFELFPVGTTPVWHEKVLYSFTGSANSVTGPEFGLAADTAGHFYGVSLSNVTSTAWVINGATAGGLLAFPK